MEVNKERAEAAKSCFEFNINQNTAFVTSDLECFANRSHAVTHARTLEDSTIDVFERDEAGEVEWNEAESDNSADEAFTIPDYDLAKELAEGSGAGEFEQNKPDAPDEPVVDQTPEISQESVMDALKGPAVDEVKDPAADEVVKPLTPAEKRLKTLAAKKAAAAKQAPEVK